MAEIVTTPAMNVCWTAYSGDRNQEMVYLQDGNGDPWDITGAVLSAQARASSTDEAVALDAICTVVDGPAGTATVEWDGDDIAFLLDGRASWEGVWDLQILEAGETRPITLVAGRFKAILDVTRSP